MYLTKTEEKSSKGFMKWMALAALGVTACYAGSQMVSSKTVATQPVELEESFLNMPELAETDATTADDGNTEFFNHVSSGLHEMVKNSYHNVERLMKVVYDVLALEKIYIFDETALGHLQGYLKVNEDSKVLGLDLSNMIKDVELLARSSKDNLARTHRVLAIRGKYEAAHRL